MVTPHKKLMGQWHTVSIDSTGDVHREITVQLEMWARYTFPEYTRSALTLVDSESLDQWSLEVSAEQAKDMAQRYGVLGETLLG